MSIDANKLRELYEESRTLTGGGAYCVLRDTLYNNAPAIADLADEVERLRKALKRISMNTNDNGSGAADFARTALAKPANGGGS